MRGQKVSNHTMKFPRQAESTAAIRLAKDAPSKEEGPNAMAELWGVLGVDGDGDGEGECTWGDGAGAVAAFRVIAEESTTRATMMHREAKGREDDDFVKAIGVGNEQGLLFCVVDEGEYL
ncbi:hypothetical protein MLD38_000127 [Melastoma candidum]|uniref:Uncharacterized protein n=1 Tax=Melastoma candidum TaxID=119954 RepID=A0ACB9S945_9MYRT|nr:hypothetical protein MLD38_000127 [Melastoma candidum]